LISEILEDAGLDRAKAREIRRQLLQGIMLFCRWQLERLDAAEPPPRPMRRKPRKVTLD
jgi:hypothetical protein